ncbi:MAG: alpha/beta hydrolase fold protein [Chitinophagaceae bacterium]|nr:alpha/beta hydrolase fold protein [Chitinophagaceae bacterium]
MNQVSNKPAVIHHDLHIHYSLSGIGDITLLFVHGSFLDETVWNSQVDYFSSSYQVVTIDLAAHGKSGNNRNTWTIEQFGQDVIALIKVLQLKNVILIGHSMGAEAILEAAVLYPQPIIGFIAIEAFKNAGTPLPEQYQQQVKEIEEKLKTDFADTSEQYARKTLLTSNTKPEIRDRIVKSYREAYEPMGIESTIDIFHYHERERELIQQLPHKMHLINVNYMPTNKEALDHYAAKSYDLMLMQGTSHFPMLESPKELNELLGEAIISITKTMNNNEILQFIEQE